MGLRRMLFVLAVLVGCRQMFGFDDPVPRVDANHGGQQCNTTGFTCNSGTPVAMQCNGCWVSCPETVSKATAAQRCNAWGGQVPELASSDARDCVRQAVPTGDLWLGLTQGSAATPGANWSWDSGFALGSSASWAASEPDDDNGGTEAGIAQCAQVPDGLATWDDVPCNAMHSFACMRDTGN